MPGRNAAALTWWLIGLSGLALPVQAALLVKISSQQGAPLADAVAYAVPLQKPAAKEPPREVLIDQINKEFTPRVTVLQAGTSVVFPNKDNIRHHVYSFSPSKVFDLKLYSGTPAKPVLFDKPGVVVLGCNIHDWMLAYVLIVDTPYFGKSGADGSIRLDGMPAGEYELKAWHPNLDGMAPVQKIRISGDKDAPYAFHLNIGQTAAAAVKP